MLIMHEFNRPYKIDELSGTLAAKYFWSFSGSLQDFQLSPILYLEEQIGPVIEISVNSTTFFVPATWHILIVDPETTLVDTVQIAECAKNNFKAFVFSSKDSNFRIADIKLVDYFQEESSIYPLIPRECMMCHPIGSTNSDADNILNIVIGPNDLYKYGLENVSAKEILYA